MSRFLTALVVAAVAVTTLGGAVVLTGGSDHAGVAADGAQLSQVEDGATADDPAAPPAPTLPPIEAFLAQIFPAGEDEALPTAQRVVLSRDPFQPVVPEPAADGTNGDGTNGDGTNGDGTDGDGTDGDGTDGDGTDGDGTDGTDGDGTDGDGTDGADEVCTGDENETVCDGVVVTLDGFTDEGLAIVVVDGTVFEVGVGQQFATSFEVLAINPPCATLLFGDEAFSICTGATVLK